MTLDEAIEHAKRVALMCKDSKCAADNWQLIEWLRRARGAEKAARWYTTRIQELEEACDEYVDIIHKMSEPDSLDNLKAENEKLRELVNDMWICISHGSEGWDCTGCKRDPDSVCIMGICEFSQRMRELGIEVGE